MNEYMVPFLTKALGTALVDIFPVSHIIKPFGVRGDIWHQDSSLVDERRDFALNAWMSFTDSNRINGCLWAIPGSHMNSNHFRQFGVNPITGSFKEELRKLMVPIPSKAGEVILFNRSLIHGSSFNWLPFNRIASECLIVNKGAILYNYHRDKSLAMNRIIGFQVPPEHFLKENPKEDFYNPNTPRIELPDISMEGIREKIQAEIPYYLTHAKKFNLSSNLT
ncbi:MAG: phytanoyl-CoA dioxygenase family protein [Flavobacteriales bacterium]|nr:phytanoyl-CoA dioxygenase family protein [Flavobacteriales bacterium]